MNSQSQLQHIISTTLYWSHKSQVHPKFKKQGERFNHLIKRAEKYHDLIFKPSEGSINFAAQTEADVTDPGPLFQQLKISSTSQYRRVIFNQEVICQVPPQNQDMETRVTYSKAPLAQMACFCFCLLTCFCLANRSCAVFAHIYSYEVLLRMAPSLRQNH